MTAIPDGARRGEDDHVVATVQSGGSTAFADLAERHRRELRVHCYRMLGNLDDADDAVQNTMVRAWAGRAGFEGRATFRAWLYRIATNACLDSIKQRRRRVTPIDQVDLGSVYDELSWLQPMPTDARSAMAASTSSDPEAAAVGREAIELVILASIQYLTPRQRAVLILRDLLQWTPAEIGDVLAQSTASVNSLLQRARARMSTLGHEQWPTRRRTPPPTPEERSRLERYIEAHARADASAVIELLAADVRLTMPPYEARYDGRAAAASFFEQLFAPAEPGSWRLIAAEANGQLAAVNYLRPAGEPELRAITVDVLTFRDGLISEIVTFGPGAVAAFALPAVLPPGSEP